jgi:hypothetical protein
VKYSHIAKASAVPPKATSTTSTDQPDVVDDSRDRQNGAEDHLTKCEQSKRR